MHSHGIYYGDIKPRNIIHRRDTVYFTNFSSSRRIEAGQNTSTDSPASATKMFAAPELYSEDGSVRRHGSQTDIYSLGLVYIQMWIVLLGKSSDEMDDYLFGRGQAARLYRMDYRFPTYFLSKLASSYWMAEILVNDRKSRPAARDLNTILRQVPLLDPLDSEGDCLCLLPPSRGLPQSWNPTTDSHAPMHGAQPYNPRTFVPADSAASLGSGLPELFSSSSPRSQLLQQRPDWSSNVQSTNSSVVPGHLERIHSVQEIQAGSHLRDRQGGLHQYNYEPSRIRSRQPTQALTESDRRSASRRRLQKHAQHVGYGREMKRHRKRRRG